MENIIINQKNGKKQIELNYINNEWKDIDMNSGSFDIIHNKLILVYNNEINKIIKYYEKINNEYYDILLEENIKYKIIHREWSDYIIIDNTELYRESIPEQRIKYKIIDDLLIIDWEFFQKNDDTYKIIENIENKKFIHKNWNDNCYIVNNKIIRSSNYDYGNLLLNNELLNNNLIKIKWQEWDEEIYRKIGDIFYHIDYFTEKKMNDKIYIFHSYDNRIYDESLNFMGNYIYENNYIIIDLNGNEYYIDQQNRYENLSKKYDYIKLLKYRIEIYCKIDLLYNKIYNHKNNNEWGYYKFDNNIIEIEWINKKCEKYILDNDKYIFIGSKKIHMIDEINGINESFINKIDKIIYDSNCVYKYKIIDKKDIKIYVIHYLDDYIEKYVEDNRWENILIKYNIYDIIKYMKWDIDFYKKMKDVDDKKYFLDWYIYREPIYSKDIFMEYYYYLDKNTDISKWYNEDRYLNNYTNIIDYQWKYNEKKEYYLVNDQYKIIYIFIKDNEDIDYLDRCKYNDILYCVIIEIDDKKTIIKKIKELLKENDYILINGNINKKSVRLILNKFFEKFYVSGKIEELL